MSAKTTYQRSAKGPVSISECSADGKYVQIENTGRKVNNNNNNNNNNDNDNDNNNKGLSHRHEFHDLLAKCKSLNAAEMNDSYVNVEHMRLCDWLKSWVRSECNKQKVIVQIRRFIARSELPLIKVLHLYLKWHMHCAHQEESLGGWTIARNIDGRDAQPFTFDRNFSIRPSGKVKVYIFMIYWHDLNGPTLINLPSGTAPTENHYNSLCIRKVVCTFGYCIKSRA